MRWSRNWIAGLAVVGLLLVPCLRQAAAAALGENSELEIGSYGSQSGQFDELRDFAFDVQGNVYTLEGLRYDQNTKQWHGNARIQKFDPESGKQLASFSVRDDKLGDKDDPQRLAIDAAGRLYVTQPQAGVVAQFAADGKLLRKIALPRARAVSRVTLQGKERIAVAASNREVVPEKGWTWLGGEQIDLIDPASGDLLEPIKLPGKLESIADIAADAAGNFYLLAAVNQIYKISPQGALLCVVGAGAETRNADGSEPLHTLALDSKGNLYAMTWGNPGLVTRYDAQFTTVTQREGQFKWADPWSVHSNYTILGIDPKDRLWAASTHVQDPKGVNYAVYHATPCLLRVQPKFFDAAIPGVIQRSALLLGLSPKLSTTLPYAIGYDLKPVAMTFAVAAATRQIQEITVAWRVQDALGAVVAKGRFDLPLRDREAADREFAWTPPRFGWYTVTTELLHKGRRLRAIGQHVGITPKFPNTIALSDGESSGGWADAPRQMFTGLANVRLHCSRAPESLDQLEKQVDLAHKCGATCFVQFSDKADCTVEIVRAAAERLKGKVPVWEIMNEPNFSMGPEDYVKLLQTIAPVIKQVDPQAKVMGPAVCGIDLGWHERFYKAGGAPLVDILSVHDYEGHETIDPVHWVAKYGALRALMAKNGDANKPVWQTERAITGVRGECFLGGAQAVRCTLHRDLLESLGIAPEHNNHYYLNEVGYGTVPSFVWSNSGPHPAALALRTRYAMTAGRRYAGKLDFGPTGNRVYLGLKYDGADGSTLVLRNLGMRDEPMTLAVRGGENLVVVDSFGNEQAVAVQNGAATVAVGQMPIYMRLSPGQSAEMPKLDFGQNVASEAVFSYSAPAEGELTLLSNGILETTHAGLPNGDCNGRFIWQGQLPLAADGSIQPQTLELAWKKPQAIGKLILWGLRADNAFCALLDYDIEYHDGQNWKTLGKLRNPFLASEPVETSLSSANTWLLDDNLFVHQFKPVTTDRLRIVVRRTTWGFVPDREGRATGMIPAKFMLREIEVYPPKQ